MIYEFTGIVDDHIYHNMVRRSDVKGLINIGEVITLPNDQTVKGRSIYARVIDINDNKITIGDL